MDLLLADFFWAKGKVDHKIIEDNGLKHTIIEDYGLGS